MSEATLPPAPTPETSPEPTPTPEPHEIPQIAVSGGFEPPAPPPDAAPQEPVPAPKPAPAPAPAEMPDEPGGILGTTFHVIAENVSRAVRPEAAAQVATTFSFPLVLMLAVVLFLVAQDQVDRRDPKLRAAPRNVFDTVVRFKEEHEL